MDKEINKFGNIGILPKNTSQLADWQFKEIIVEKMNELILKMNEVGISLSSEEENDQKENDQKETKKEKSKYKVLYGLEHPKGIIREIDEIIELTKEEADGFTDEVIEKIQ